MGERELSWRERGRLWARLGIRLALAALCIWLLVRAVPPLLSLFMPFVLAFVAAWLLNPLVRGIQKRLGAPRKLLSLLLILLILAVAGGLVTAFVWNIVSELISLANNWSAILEAVQAGMDAVSRFFSRFMALLPTQINAAVDTALRDLSSHLLSWLSRTLPDLVSAAALRTTGVARRVPSFAVAAVVFLMGSYYITADYPHIRFLVSSRFSGRARRFLTEVRAAAMSAFGGYVKAEFILSVGVFLILLTGFTLAGQPYGLLLAFLLAVLDFIPIVGAGTVMVPWAVVDLCLGNLRQAVELMVIWGVIALFRRVGEPKIVGDQTGLPPVVSLISIYVGMRLAGVLGMILAPVVCMVFLNICRLGVFTPVLEDLRLAAGDLAAFLRDRPSPGGNSKNM